MSNKKILGQIALTRRINHIDHLRRLWDAICRGEDWTMLPPKLESHEEIAPGQAPYCHIAAEEMITSSGDAKNLGPVPRLFLVLNTLAEAEIEAFAGSRSKQDILLAAHNLAAERRSEPTTSQKMRHHADRVKFTTYDTYVTKPEWSLIEDGLADLLNRVRGMHRVYTRTNLFQKPFVGTDALAHFERFLRDASSGADDVPLKYVALGSERRNVPSDLINQIMDDDDLKRPMLVNVHADGRWRDAAALSQLLEQELKHRPMKEENRKTVVRIMLTRYAQTEQQNPGLSDEAFKHSISYDELLIQFANRLGITLPDAARPDASAIVRAARLRLAEKPFVVIFEGYYEPLEPIEHDQNVQLGAELLRVVRDDHLKHLLLRLMEPPIADYGVDDSNRWARPLDLTTFRKSRFVVFSNRPLSYFDELSQLAENLTSLHLPNPSVAEMQKTLHLCTLPYQNVLVDAHDGVCDWLRKVDYEPVFDLLSAHLDLLVSSDPTYSTLEPDEQIKHGICLIKYMGNDPDCPLSESDTPGSMTSLKRRALLRWVMRRHLELLRERSDSLYELHLFLTFVPCGLRHVTLTRIARRMRNLQVSQAGIDCHVPFSALTKEAALNRLPKDAVGSPGSLLTAYQSDVFRGFDQAPPLFETILLPDMPVQEPVGYDYNDPLMKEVAAEIFLEEASADGSANELRTFDVHVVHRMISDESLSQQTVSLNYSGVDYLQSIRSLRRQISGIYHGLLSIPLRITSQVAEIDDTVRIDSPYLAGPSEAREYFEWIYFFIYRRMIERPPAWNLSRHYALDRLKLDVLQGADTPWLLKGAAKLTTQPSKTASLFDLLYQQDQPHLREDFLVNSLHALTALGLLVQAKETIERRSQVPNAEVWQNSSMHPELKRLKDQLDINILNQRQPLNACWRKFWHVVSGGLVASESNKRVPSPGFETLDGRSFCPNRFDAHVEAKTTAFLGNIGRTRTDIENSYLDPLDAGFANEIAAELGSSKTISAVADCLFRLSELVAMDADVLRSQSVLKQLDVSKGAADRISEIHANYFMDTVDDMIDPNRYFCRALAIYDLAEALRLIVFRSDPNSAHFFASAHSGRSGVRTALILERESRKRRLKQYQGYTHVPSEARLGFFSQKARRICERLVKHTFRYPRERASMMIIECSILRMMSETLNDERPEDLSIRHRALISARRYLQEAESIVIVLSRRNRVRMRLALERSKLSLAFADLTEDPIEKERYVALAEYDIEFLYAFAREPPLVTWEIIAAIQKKKISLIRHRAKKVT